MVGKASSLRSDAQPRAWIARLGMGFGESVGDVFFARTRGRARKEAASQFECDFCDKDLTMIREARLDSYCDGRRIPDSVMREVGFTDSDGRRCDSCGLGDPTDGYGDLEWRICGECHQCGECGCSDDCESEA